MGGGFTVKVNDLCFINQSKYESFDLECSIETLIYIKVFIFIKVPQFHNFTRLGTLLCLEMKFSK